VSYLPMNGRRRAVHALTIEVAATVHLVSLCPRAFDGRFIMGALLSRFARCPGLVTLRQTFVRCCHG
jgi:hypothetical protein